ncbi:hypothetical protein GCM10011376_31740 [Nocardioides flavus (ex Wang et al. 2016)]|uniref:Uncharacterized protein n=1 Tax=Nocardioides flavus (ex Wang et al. 2016) TaxID=2058780 RepID=A0ABQ3HPL7_9ACTN|nr:hypothetical protein [Nocardioides flavus (ex Wang et al. 2016)]GHE18564.1 hypothetical protein GCM10011376_31740 [Nocardioides flavus (ex Wang et al. 2016)]
MTAGPAAEMYLPHFVVKQKLTMMVNRYEVSESDEAGNPTRLMAFAEQKRMAFKEQVTFFTDASRSRAVFGFKARKRLDLNAGYDITDESGAQIGFFRKDFGASLLRSTFHVEGPGYAGTGQERNQLVGLLRRFTELDFIPVHFDFVDSAGSPLFSVERKMSIGDRYRVSVPDQRVDFRVAAAVAVALDALMSR